MLANAVCDMLSIKRFSMSDIGYYSSWYASNEHHTANKGYYNVVSYIGCIELNCNQNCNYFKHQNLLSLKEEDLVELESSFIIAIEDLIQPSFLKIEFQVDERKICQEEIGFGHLNNTESEIIKEKYGNSSNFIKIVSRCTLYFSRNYQHKNLFIVSKVKEDEQSDKFKEIESKKIKIHVAWGPEIKLTRNQIQNLSTYYLVCPFNGGPEIRYFWRLNKIKEIDSLSRNTNQMKFSSGHKDFILGLKHYILDDIHLESSRFLIECLAEVNCEGLSTQKSSSVSFSLLKSGKNYYCVLKSFIISKMKLFKPNF